MIVNLAVKGYHFFKMTDDILRAEMVSAYMNSSLERLEKKYETQFRKARSVHPRAVERLAKQAMDNVSRLYRKLNPELKEHLKDTYYEYKLKCETTAYLWSEKSGAEDEPYMNESSYASG